MTLACFGEFAILLLGRVTPDCRCWYKNKSELQSQRFLEIIVCALNSQITIASKTFRNVIGDIEIIFQSVKLKFYYVYCVNSCYLFRLSARIMLAKLSPDPNSMLNSLIDQDRDACTVLNDQFLIIRKICVDQLVNGIDQI